MDNLPDEVCELIAAHHPWKFLVVSRRFRDIIEPKLDEILAARRRFLHIDGEKWTRPRGDIMDFSLEIERTKFVITDSDPVYRTTIVPDGCSEPDDVKLLTRYSDVCTGPGIRTRVITTVTNSLFAISLRGPRSLSGLCHVKLYKTDPRSGLHVKVHGIGYGLDVREILLTCKCYVTVWVKDERLEFAYTREEYSVFTKVVPKLQKLLRRITIPGIMRWVTDPDAML